MRTKTSLGGWTWHWRHCIFPIIRGSDQTRFYPVPVPLTSYIAATSSKADRNGLRGEFFNRDYVELNLSVNATVPVESNDDHARRGMPNLRPTIEVDRRSISSMALKRPAF